MGIKVQLVPITVKLGADSPMPLLRKLKSCGGGSQMDLLPSKKCVIHNHLSTMVRLFDSLCDSNRQIKFKSSAQRVAEEGIPGSPKMSVLHEKVLKFKLLFASVLTDVFLFFWETYNLICTFPPLEHLKTLVFIS